ncbi:hypothetical protein [Coleofasciculus sp. FACHB-129]|uniref:hypothetical protein n=1 Tax=Cyanophyceae TaxID=3028117 RepID=UPI00168665CB|nr:hypothetical protein [Coleofasciculus sp. FACHB-129]MBD1895887.1 hypothetical protein [Coleofasciculus sp. FACHB-129]
MSDRIYQEISQLCHDAGVPAVLASVQRYCQIRADWQRSEGEPFDHWLDVVEAIAQVLEGWDEGKEE